ncbi:MAG TPA: hypothetical protein VD962_01250 [Rubricoccaceae bacterium]|nr:hypothetical protein [Rubricoccaceae bacterium]
MRCSLLLCFLVATTAAAQPGPWTPLGGPQAARLVGAAVSGDGTPYAVSDTETHRYNAGAARWEDVASTFTGAFSDVAGAPGGEAWAGTGGVFHIFADGTWDWFPVRTGHEGIPLGVERIAVGPDGTVYVTGLFVGGGGGPQVAAFRSTNNGQSWPEMTVAPAAMAFVGTTAYAGTLDGVFTSANSGATWTPSGIGGHSVGALAASGTRLAAATTGALWTSPDGATWTQAAALGGVEALAASGNGAVWAATPGGLYRSTDGGQTWPAAPSFFEGQPIHDVAASGLTVLAIVNRVPHRSTDGGQTWAEIPDGLGLRHAQDAISAGGALAVATNGAGPFRSTDGGQTWTLWTDGIDPLTGREFVADPTAGWIVLSTHNRIYRTALDGSAPWTPLAFPGDRPIGLAFDGGLLFASVSLPDPGSPGRLLRSADGGQTWTVAFEEPGSFVGSPEAGGGIVALPIGSFTAPTLRVSADGGQTWLVRPHPTAEPFDGMPRLFVDAAGALYVGDDDDNRLRRSTDLGATWTPLGPMGSPATRPLSLLVEVDAGVLCAGTNEGVFCSTDGGATFTPASAGLPSSEEGGQDVLDLFRDGPRYVALMDDEGLFVSLGTTAAEPGVPAPSASVALSAPTPNPSRGAARLTLALTEAQAVSVALYDALGRRVATLHEGPLHVGTHPLIADVSVLAPGVYVVRAEGRTGVSAPRRLVVAR